MFDHTSRYYAIADAIFYEPGGRPVPYKLRRFVPSPDALPLLAEVRIGQGDRLDVMTARTLGDPQQFWRVCDANRIMRPEDATSEIGRVLRIPVPQA